MDVVTSDKFDHKQQQVPQPQRKKWRKNEEKQKNYLKVGAACFLVKKVDILKDE